ncbi:hypothetical protein NC652_028956 [Populus alba x Populus x berolinensis]|nr:hypothetical protein NC652_028956 [Populus alba x Populus x berolinensis]
MESKVVLSGALAVASMAVLVFSSPAIDDGSHCMDVCLAGCASAANPKLLITCVNNCNSRHRNFHHFEIDRKTPVSEQKFFCVRVKPWEGVWFEKEKKDTELLQA